MLEVDLFSILFSIDADHNAPPCFLTEEAWPMIRATNARIPLTRLLVCVLILFKLLFGAFAPLKNTSNNDTALAINVAAVPLPLALLDMLGITELPET